MQIVKFKNVALGCRFSYIGSEKIWIKIGGPKGVIAEYDPKLIGGPWPGQQLAVVSDNEDEVQNLAVMTRE